MTLLSVNFSLKESQKLYLNALSNLLSIRSLLSIVHSVVIQKKLQCVSIAKTVKNMIRFENSVVHSQQMTKASESLRCKCAVYRQYLKRNEKLNRGRSIFVITDWIYWATYSDRRSIEKVWTKERKKEKRSMNEKKNWEEKEREIENDREINR